MAEVAASRGACSRHAWPRQRREQPLTGTANSQSLPALTRIWASARALRQHRLAVVAIVPDQRMRAMDLAGRLRRIGARES
eukprot:173996-Rhodomonas_salina.2